MLSSPVAGLELCWEVKDTAEVLNVLLAATWEGTRSVIWMKGFLSSRALCTAYNPYGCQAAAV